MKNLSYVVCRFSVLSFLSFASFLATPLPAASLPAVSFGASAEGVSYAIILSNLFVPLIERVTMPTAFGKRGVAK